MMLLCLERTSTYQKEWPREGVYGSVIKNSGQENVLASRRGPGKIYIGK